MGNWNSEAISADVKEELDKSDDLGKFLRENADNMLDIPLSEYLNHMLYEKDLRVADVVRDSGLSKSYVHQIFNGERNPSREKLLPVAFGLHLNEIETQRMLRLAGHNELHARINRDAAILFCIRKGYDLSRTDKELHDNGFETILPKD